MKNFSKNFVECYHQNPVLFWVNVITLTGSLITTILVFS